MIPLTVRSHFSLMWGTAAVDRLCRAARGRGYTHLALTDTDNLYGLWPFLRCCQREGITPIVGTELTDAASDRRAVCLVESDEGYANLCRLLSRRHRDPGFELQTALPDLARGLVVLTAHPELLAQWHEAGVTVAAAMHRRCGGAAMEALQTARRLGLSAVATPGSFFVDPDEHQVHRVLRAIDRRSALSRLKPGQLAPADAWLAPPTEYQRRFQLAPRTLRASQQIAERCAAFTGPRHGIVLPPWSDDRHRSAASVLREAAFSGARWRYGDDLSEAAVERLEHELRLIEDKEFSSYFLTVQRIVRSSPRICGRGSGAASLVAYCLGITNVCPLKHELYFERFLNPGRTDPPDIDVDFAWDERDDVLQQVLDAHPGHAAMVCNHVLFKPRMAVREVARVFGIPDQEIKRVMRQLPMAWRERYHGDAREVPPAPDGERRRLSEPWPEILELARRILGAPRYLSVHAGGMVITPGPIDSYVPVEQAPKGVPIVQWEKDGTEESGLVKIDLLGNRSLGVIRDALANLRQNDVPFDERRWEPEDDSATQRAVAQGRTMGCFYIESPAMRLLQQKTGRGDFEHLVIHSSIIRPAANEFIREYVRRLKGGAWESIHPLLTDVLAETYGIMVYQEDVSRTAVALAGFSHADADGLRKILSKKDKEHQLRDYHERFVAGARARGVDPERIEAVWAMMMSFDGYSFCKPHSASYARVSFQAAFLKVHFPAEFMAAVISNGGGFYSAFAYVSEARRLGLSVLPPDVNASHERWRGRQRNIRVGLMSIKGLTEVTRQRIVQLRETGGPYRSFDDFVQRVRPGEDEARALIHAGACDALTPREDRSAQLWHLLHFKRNVSRGRNRGTADLFSTDAPVPAPRLPATDQIEQLRRQYAVLGFLCDRHPMTLFEPQLRHEGLVKARDLHLHVGRQVRCAGCLVTAKLVPTRKGEPMEFVTFEDETGLMETTIFPRAYRRFGDMLDRHQPFVLRAVVEEDFGAITLTVNRVERLTRRTATRCAG